MDPLTQYTSAHTRPRALDEPDVVRTARATVRDGRRARRRRVMASRLRSVADRLDG
ncbi:hypothetical protein [Nocardioides sp. R-C-SC26]|uniref:hypothetical protein n=1 Tax=Nocardioides sp. R-C-SC26 TaxID=2870414 RepID=UPI001E65A927|nr:hypothetical protein [Nocardioides sp. R-C-SC26]